MGFLSNVCIYTPYNKMSAANLALVFGPNLLWNSNDPLGGSLGSIRGVVISIQLMIDHFEQIFEQQ